MCRSILSLLLVLALGTTAYAERVPRGWQQDWPKTDFSKHTVPLKEIKSVVPRGAIPAIHKPRFVPVAKANHLGNAEPVIGLIINGEARAYPLQIMTWHEIVNDEVGGVPVAVTYCPLCNAAVAFDRRLGERTLSFGVSGKLRHSDLIMYDWETLSWWQQFTGESIVGELAGDELTMLPARLESFAAFRNRAPNGLVLVPRRKRQREYGENPYPRYDSAEWPFMFDGKKPRGLPPLARLITVGERAWTLDHVRRNSPVNTNDGLVITWSPGQNSALDTREIVHGYDVGNVVVQRRSEDGTLEDVPYGIDFAFAFHAFYPDTEIVRR